MMNVYVSCELPEAPEVGIWHMEMQFDGFNLEPD